MAGKRRQECFPQAEQRSTHILTGPVEQPLLGLAWSITVTPASPWDPLGHGHRHRGHGGDIWPQPSRPSRLCPAAIYSQLQMLAPQRATDRRTEGSSVAAQTLPALFFRKSASDFPTQPCDPFGSHPGWWSSLSSHGTRLGRENISSAVCPRAERSPYQATEKPIVSNQGAERSGVRWQPAAPACKGKILACSTGKSPNHT